MSGGRSAGVEESPCRLAVLGTLVLDTIRRPEDAEPVEAPGGIVYALAALEARPPDGWAVVPVMKVGADAAGVAEDLLDRLGSVASREGVRTVTEPNNRVELVYDDSGERTERLTGGVPGWTHDELAPVLAGCDALYVNLVAGWEVDLACAARLRENLAGPVYCDLHSLFLDRGDGVRRRRAPPGWREWLRCFDYVQLNADELATLADDAGEEPWRLARSLAGGDGPRVLFVTLGAEGAAWVTGDAAGPTHAHAEDGGEAADRTEPRIGRAAPPTVEDGDPTGCGDVWGATCFGALLEGADPAAAVARANGLAARNASRSGGLGLLGAGRDRVARDPGGAGPRGRGGDGRVDARHDGHRRRDGGRGG